MLQFLHVTGRTTVTFLTQRISLRIHGNLERVVSNDLTIAILLQLGRMPCIHKHLTRFIWWIPEGTILTRTNLPYKRAGFTVRWEERNPYLARAAELESAYSNY